MQAITLEAVRYLAVAGATHGAAIKSVHGRKWAVTLLGKVDYVPRSKRQNPRIFGTLQTAIGKIRYLGLTRCELHFDPWQGNATRGCVVPMSSGTSDDEAHLG